MYGRGLEAPAQKLGARRAVQPVLPEPLGRAGTLVADHAGPRVRVRETAMSDALRATCRQDRPGEKAVAPRRLEVQPGILAAVLRRHASLIGCGIRMDCVLCRKDVPGEDRPSREGR